MVKVEIRMHRTKLSNTNTGIQFAKIRRQWLNMSQAELAEALNCSRNIVSRVEIGQTEYKLSNLIAFQELCGGISINVLLMLPDTKEVGWLADYAKLSTPKRTAFDAMAAAAIKLAK